jgi:hypothetical protein
MVSVNVFAGEGSRVQRLQKVQRLQSTTPQNVSPRNSSIVGNPLGKQIMNAAGTASITCRYAKGDEILDRNVCPHPQICHCDQFPGCYCDSAGWQPVN